MWWIFVVSTNILHPLKLVVSCVGMLMVEKGSGGIGGGGGGEEEQQYLIAWKNDANNGATTAFISPQTIFHNKMSSLRAYKA